MATGNTIIPFGSEQFQEASDWFNEVDVFFPDTLRHARYPTQNELLKAIDALGFELEEANDWYVTSKNDFTEIWFSSDPGKGDTPVEFWCRRGNEIALDIGQSITNVCGSLIVINHSDTRPVLLVPDDAFPLVPPMNNQERFFDTIAYRAPFLIKGLQKAKTFEILFILSQILCALQKAHQTQFNELLQVTREGLEVYISLLDHTDTRVRRLASELITLFRNNMFQRLEPLRLSIAREPDTDTKTRMINAIKKLLIPGYIGQDINPAMQSILDFFHKLSEKNEEAPSVRLATAILLAEAQPGMLTPAMRAILTDALTNPDRFALKWNYPGSVFSQALEVLEKLLVNHRTEILMQALPDIDVAEDAHDATRALLDYVFFGAIRPTQMSSLPDSTSAERATIVMEKFRSKSHPPMSWLYPTHPINLSAQELLPIQREALQVVIALELPWMVHSNLLEKYGLPPTRESTREML